MSEAKHLDVVIVGAGLSGIDAAAHIAKAFPGRNYAVLEQRHELGGTWSLFKYPGIRSDSDMFTLGYGVRLDEWPTQRHPPAVPLAGGSTMLSDARRS